MKWTKSETLKEKNRTVKRKIIYDNIIDAVVDFMCPCMCGGKCPLYDYVKLENGTFEHKCNREYILKNEQEVANLIGVKPYEENPGEKSLLDWTVRDVIEYYNCEMCKSCNGCKISMICKNRIGDWEEFIKYKDEHNRKRKLGTSEIEYLKQAHRFGYEWISCDDKNGVYLHKKIPTWLMAYNMFQITEGSEKSEFAFTIGQGEYWEISKLLEENKNV